MPTPTIPAQAYSHTHPEAGGLVLCPDCAAEAITQGKSHPLTHADLAPNWNFPITVRNPVYCDNCSKPVVAADTPVDADLRGPAKADPA